MLGNELHCILHRFRPDAGVLIDCLVAGEDCARAVEVADEKRDLALLRQCTGKADQLAFPDDRPGGAVQDKHGRDFRGTGWGERLHRNAVTAAYEMRTARLDLPTTRKRNSERENAKAQQERKRPKGFHL